MIWRESWHAKERVTSSACGTVLSKGLHETIKKLLKNRLVEPACSPYNAVAMPIKKSSGGYRVVLDYRALNLNTTRDTYPLPNIDSHLFSLGKANLFTTIDLLMGFHQCELDDVIHRDSASPHHHADRL